MSSIVVGADVYYPSEEEVWAEARVADYDQGSEVVTVTDNDGKSHSLDLKSKALLRKLVGEDSSGTVSLPLQNVDAGPTGVEDMTTLNYLHEAAILYNVRTRFLAQCPYTYTGDIVIAVNPYQWLPLYTDELHHKYLSTPKEELPPHAYATSVNAYKRMWDLHENQSILVSGESGAGKTETTKILMGHVAAISTRSTSLSAEASMGDDTTIQSIIKANPLLESFGNAKTTRNDNSSRFGKFTVMQFNEAGLLVGAQSRTYLLEKSRILAQSEGERDYHVFYQVRSYALL
jgi:myosin-5